MKHKPEMAKWLWSGLLLAGIVCLTGCAERREAEGAITYVFPAWTWLSAFLLGGVFSILGMRAGQQGWRWWLLAGAAWFLFTPGLYGDRAVLTRESFDLHRGFPFHGNSLRVSFDQVKKLQLRTHKDSKGRLKTRIIFEGERGPVGEIPMGDLVRAVMPDLMRILTERHVEILQR